MEIRSFFDGWVRGVPLWVIGLCGMVGILVDVDHPISLWFTGRFSQADHIPLAIISCVVLFGVGACIGGLYLRFVLGRRTTKNRNPTIK